MINLAVINLKTLIKKIVQIIIVILIIAMIFKFVKIIYNGINSFEVKKVVSKNSIINDNIVISNYFENEENMKKNSGLKKILVSQLAIFSGTDFKKNDGSQPLPNMEEQNEVDENAIKVEVQSEESVQKEDLQTVSEQAIQTQVIEVNNKKDVYTDVYNSVQIKNESIYSLTAEMINPNINYSNNGIIIYHTHTCESYTPTENSQYIASRKLQNN